jgi:hypothetical protein
VLLEVLVVATGSAEACVTAASGPPASGTPSWNQTVPNPGSVSFHSFLSQSVLDVLITILYHHYAIGLIFCSALCTTTPPQVPGSVTSRRRSRTACSLLRPAFQVPVLKVPISMILVSLFPSLPVSVCVLCHAPRLASVRDPYIF